jgi:putative transcriptional regulator
MARLSGAGRTISALALCLSAAATSPAADLAPGRFLVASRQVSEVTFAGTVVLLIRHDGRGAMGLIVNRRSEVNLSKLFPAMPKSRSSTDPVYIGGPVGRTGVIALARSRAAPEGAARIFADVHMIADRDLLEQTIAAGARQGEFRVYLGYSGWTKGRLEREVEAGSWHVLAADTAQVFDPKPDSLWSRLMQRIEGLRARRPSPAATRRSGA